VLKSPILPGLARESLNVRLAALNLREISGWIQRSQSQKRRFPEFSGFTLNSHVLTFYLMSPFLCKYIEFMFIERSAGLLFRVSGSLRYAPEPTLG